MNQPFMLEDVRQARKYFDAALQLDEENVDALVGITLTYTREARTLALAGPADRKQIATADAASARALRLAPNDALAHYARATALIFLGVPEQVLRECEIAINLDRNFALAHGIAGFATVLLGRPEEADAPLIEAIRLSPRDPELSTWYYYIATAKFQCGELDQAIEAHKKSIQINPNYNLPYFLLAAILTLKGRDAEATAVREAGLRVDHSFTIAKFRVLGAALSDNATFLSQRARLIEAMRKAGVPEG